MPNEPQAASNEYKSNRNRIAQSVRIISLEYPEQTSSKMHKNIEIKRKCKELRALADSALWLP